MRPYSPHAAVAHVYRPYLAGPGDAATVFDDGVERFLADRSLAGVSPPSRPGASLAVVVAA